MINWLEVPPSHLLILCDSPSRDLMRPLLQGRLGPQRWGWRRGLVLLHLLQHHNTHTTSTFWPHQEHNLTHSFARTPKNTVFFLTYVCDPIAQRAAVNPIKSSSHINKRAASSCENQHKNPALSSICQCRLCSPSLFLSLSLSNPHSLRLRQQGIPLRNGGGKRHECGRMSLGCLAACRKLHILSADSQPGTHAHTDPAIRSDGGSSTRRTSGNASLSSLRLLKPALS